MPATEMAEPAPMAQQRVVRVFISSTFRDMHAEREELIKRVFPQLRKLCEQRGVIWSEVDLRWGVTDEQKAEGGVLPICLAEIHNCRPYFIGLLGERYGWVPDEIAAELIEREPWLAGQAHRSVTELEILHGVLNNPAMAQHAFFYFRSPTFIESLAADQQSLYREVPAPDEIDGYGADEAERRAEDRRRNLVTLKARIRQSGLPIREDYPDPRALGQLVLRDLTEVIDRLYPEGSQPDPLDREAAEHEAFARSRARVYIGRDAYFDRLDAHVQGDEPPLVVVGESGSGKSALLANWAIRYRARHPARPAEKPALLWARLVRRLAASRPPQGQAPVLMHFVGASSPSADWIAMLRRLMGELRRHFDIGEEIPDQPDALRTAFANWLHRAAARGRVVLILDALNQLDDRDGAPDLVWLPPVIPAKVRLIVSSLPGRPLEELARRGWPTLRVEPLEPEERRHLVIRYLAQFTKALSPELVERLAAAQPTANPLYLRALLEELRVYGDHVTLRRRIEHYLAATTVDDLYQKTLERYEEDYERDRPGLVRDAMSLLWAARRGLSEVELLEMLGSNGAPLPRAHWSPLHLAVEESLINCAGLVGFSHDYLRRAVGDRYLPSPGEQQAAHLRLADYFFERRPRTGQPSEGSAGQAVLARLRAGERDSGRQADGVSRRLGERIARSHNVGVRVVDELPWQLAQAHAWQRLHDLLAEPRFCGNAWALDKKGVLRYWLAVKENTPLRPLDAYRPVLADPTPHRDYLLELASLLESLGHAREAVQLMDHLGEYHRKAGEFDSLAYCLSTLAGMLTRLGDLDRADALFKDAHTIGRKLGYASSSADSLEYGDLLRVRGDLRGALRLYREAEREASRRGNSPRLQAALGNQALVYQAQGELERAWALLQEQERICRALGDKLSLQTCLGNRAVILRMRGDLDGARRLLQEKIGICQEVDNRRGMALAWNEQALILHAMGDTDGALKLLRKSEETSRALGDREGLRVNLGNQAGYLVERGDLEEAGRLLEEEAGLVERLKNPAGLAKNLAHRALLLMKQKEHARALALLKEQEQICRDGNHPMGLALALANQAAALCEGFDRVDVALRLAEEAYAIAAQHGFEELAKKTQNLVKSIRGATERPGATDAREAI